MKKITIMIVAASMLLMLATTGGAETMKTRIGKLSFTRGYPREKTTQKLYEELDFQRAVQANLWALPMASYGAMADESIRLGCAQSVHWLASNQCHPTPSIMATCLLVLVVLLCGVVSGRAV